MSPWLLYYLIGNSITALGLGLLVLASGDARGREHLLRSWRFLLCSTIVWLVSAAISSYWLFIGQTTLSNIATRLAGVAGGTSAMASLVFFQFLVGRDAPFLGWRWLQVQSGIGGLLSLIPLLPDWTTQRRFENGVEVWNVGPVYIFYALWICVVLLACVALLLHASRRTSNERDRFNFRMLLATAAAVVLIIFFCQALLPKLGVFEMVPLGYGAALALFMCSAYLILFHRFLDLKDFAIRAVLYLLVLALPAAALLLFRVIPYSTLPWGTATLVAIALSLVFFLYFRFAAEFAERALFPGRRVQEGELMALTEALEDVREAQIGPGGIMEQALFALCKVFHAERAVLVCAGRRARDAEQRVLGPTPAFAAERRFRPFLRRLRLTTDLAHVVRPIFFLEEDGPRPRVVTAPGRRPRTALIGRLMELFSAARAEGFEIAVAILVQNQLCGYLLLGRKRTGARWYAGDARLLETARVPIALALNGAMLERELRVYADFLDEHRETLLGTPAAEEHAERKPATVLVFGRPLIYRDPRMSAVLERVRQIAGRGVPVLITGETGTGKELIARLVHQEARLPIERFVAVNSTAIPEGLVESELFGHAKGAFTDARSDKPGLIEQAAGGTLFLDEIGELSLAVQPKLLRLIEEREFRRVGEQKTRPAGCSFVFATHRNLQGMMEQGLFRADLYYRLRLFEVHLPPLRERRADIPYLVEYLLQSHAAQLAKPVLFIEQGAMDLLCRYDWPGNVRQLQNCMMHACIASNGDSIRLADLPEGIVATRKERISLAPGTAAKQFKSESALDSRGLDPLVDDYTRDLVNYALQRARTLAGTSKMLRISRQRLDRILEKLQIAKPMG